VPSEIQIKFTLFIANVADADPNKNLQSQGKEYKWLKRAIRNYSGI